jgi:type IV pilus assembly protein PilM
MDRQLISGNLPSGWRENNYPPFLANLQQSISRALQTYVSTTQKNRPEAIYVTGGIANLEGLCEDLSADLSMTVELFDPFSEMKISDKALAKNIQGFAPQLTIAAGLASRSFNSWHL